MPKSVSDFSLFNLPTGMAVRLGPLLVGDAERVMYRDESPIGRFITNGHWLLAMNEEHGLYDTEGLSESISELLDKKAARMKYLGALPWEDSFCIDLAKKKVYPWDKDPSYLLPETGRPYAALDKEVLMFGSERGRPSGELDVLDGTDRPYDQRYSDMCDPVPVYTYQRSEGSLGTLTLCKGRRLGDRLLQQMPGHYGIDLGYFIGLRSVGLTVCLNLQSPMKRTRLIRRTNLGTQERQSTGYRPSGVGVMLQEEWDKCWRNLYVIIPALATSLGGHEGKPIPVVGILMPFGM